MLNTSRRPTVSVLLAVYNGGRYLPASLDSLLHQTLRDIEVIAVDDGSTDDSAALLAAVSRHDARLKVVSRENRGLSFSLNEARALATGRYLARMDADDLCLPRRLELQATFLDAHPDVDVCGSFARTFGAFPWRSVRPPVADAAIRCELVFNNPLVHPAVMLRADVFDRLGGYDPAIAYAQDYELWSRALGLAGFANLPRTLLRYRRHREQMGSVYAASVQRAENERIFTTLLGYLGLAPSAAELSLHFEISRCDAYFAAPSEDLDFPARAGAWLEALGEANRVCRAFPEPEFTQTLGRYWFAVCRAACHLGPAVARRWPASPLAGAGHIGRARRLAFAADCRARQRLWPNIPYALLQRLAGRMTRG